MTKSEGSTMNRFSVFLTFMLCLAGGSEAQMVIGTFSGSVNYSTAPINGYVAYIDISSGTVRPVVTAPLAASSPCAQQGYPVALTSTPSFVSSNSGIVLATNANLGPGQPSYSTGFCGVPYGLLKNNGAYLNPIEVIQGATGPSLLFFSNSSAMIGTPTPAQGENAVWAVSGWAGCDDTSTGPGTALLIAGSNSGSKAQPVPTEIAPRVGAGITQDGTTLILAMVNGVEPHIGLELYDFADLFKGLGAWNAVNLDGGGSSTFMYQPGGNVTQPSSLITLFDNAKPVNGNPNGLTWKLTMVPANQNCISYPNGNVTNPSQLCLSSPGTGYRPVYANLGFVLVSGDKVKKP
jgi:phosphodiester glycosidase